MTTVQSADGPLQWVSAVVTYAGLGAAWNLGNVGVKKAQSGEKMIWRRLAQSAILGAIAGVIVAMWGDEANPGNFELAMAVAVPLFDKVVDAVKAGHTAYEDSQDETGNADTTADVVAGLNAALRELNGEEGSAVVGVDENGDVRVSTDTEKAGEKPTTETAEPTSGDATPGEPEANDDEPNPTDGAEARRMMGVDRAREKSQYAGEDGGP